MRPIPIVPRGSPLCSASSSSSAILRSPSSRAGWPAGSGSIRRWIRLRTWSAKWGVEAPARARMSSALTSWPRARAARGSRPRSSLASDLGQLGEAVDFGLLFHLDGLLVSDHPNVVVEGARRVGRVARLDVEQVPAQRRRKRIGVVGEQQRPPGPGGRERRRGRGVERLVAAGDDEAVAGVVDVPAEAAVAGSGRGRSRSRPGPRRRRGAPGARSSAILRSTSEEIAEEGPST